MSGFDFPIREKVEIHVTVHWEWSFRHFSHRLRPGSPYFEAGAARSSYLDLARAGAAHRAAACPGIRSQNAFAYAAQLCSERA